MSDGLASGDFEAYSASFALSPENEAQQREIFANLQSVPFSRKDVVALEFDKRAYDSSGGEVATTAAVSLVHQIEGADLLAVGQRYGLSLVKEDPDAPVVVVAVGEPDYSGASLYPQPWDLGPMHVAATERAVIFGAAEDAAMIDAAAPLVDAGAGEALDGLGGQGVSLPRRVVVAIPGADETIDSFYDDQSTVITEASGVAIDQMTAPFTDIEGNEIAGHDSDTYEGAGRIVISRGTAEAGGQRLREVAAHETAHLVQFAWRPTNSQSEAAHQAGEDAVMIEGTPRWMTEGFADYAGHGYGPGAAGSDEYRWALQAARNGGAELHKGDARSFYEGGPEAVAQRYGLGMTAFMYVEETRGRDVALRWGFSLFNAPSTEALGRTYTDHLGTSAAEFEAAWSAWLRGRA
jgi:hypothetical protein